MQGEKIEFWKPVVGYEGIYECSSFGNIRSVDRVITYKDGRRTLTKGTNLKPSICKSTGYYQVSLCKNGLIVKRDVHKIIANTFLENPNNFPCINHKDETRTNNSIDNLEFCTHKYNSNYGTSRQRIAKSIRNNSNKVKQVSQFDFSGNKIKTYDCIADVENDGFLPCCVQSCCNPKTKDITHKKFIWVFTENEQSIKDLVKIVASRKRMPKNTPINMYDLQGNFIDCYKSASDIEKIYGIDHTSISRCCRGTQRRTKKYTFKYAE